MEKIKTIGDGFYVAFGVPEARAVHADVIASVALETMCFSDRVQLPLADKLQIRIGIYPAPSPGA